VIIAKYICFCVSVYRKSQDFPSHTVLLLHNARIRFVNDLHLLDNSVVSLSFSLLICSVFTHMCVSMCFCLFFLRVSVCFSCSMDLRGLIQINKERKNSILNVFFFTLLQESSCLYCKRLLQRMD